MNFQDFAAGFGLRISSVIPGRWVAVPTDDHPRKRNGRYKYLGDVGWVQNWATMQTPEMWKTDRPLPEIRRYIPDDRSELAAKAAAKAGWIMHQASPSTHAYLGRKGFPDELGNVWNKLLVVPMRQGSKLVGCQLIDNEGNKKFLNGQVTKGASFVMDAKGLPIFCEGYATGLSVRAVMKAMKIRYTIFVTFSAGNLKTVAGNVVGGIVVADNDRNGVGEQVARGTGKPYWISEALGEDFNDFHGRVGLFRAMKSLKRVIVASSAGTALQSGERAPC